MSYSPTLGRFLECDPIGYGDGMNPYEFVGDNPLTGLDPLGLYDETGHFYTAYLVAIAAGKSQAAAYEFAYYTEYPDEVSDYDAADRVINSGGGSILSGIFAGMGNEAGIQKAQREYQWAKDINEVLHSLHGGDAEAVKKRRACLKKLLESGTLNTWEKGLVTHALGDAYAHTTKEDTAYPWPWGHFKPGGTDKPGTDLGHNVDAIARNPTKYQMYVLALYDALGGQSPMGNAQLLTILNNAPKMPMDKAAALKQMQGLATQFGYNNPYIPGLKKEDQAMKSLSRQEVQVLINKIKKACNC